MISIIKNCFLRRNSVLIWFLILLTSCASNRYFIVQIDSLSTKYDNKTKYILFPGNIGTTPEDLIFREFSEYINFILSQNGFEICKQIEEADFIIGLSYGISGPHSKITTQPIPIFETELVNIPGYITPVPMTKLKQIAPITSTQKEYFRYLFLVAYDAKEYINNQKLLPIWQIFASSWGYLDDLRTVFPALAYAVAPYIGKDTKGKIQIIVNENEVKKFFQKDIKEPKIIR